MKYHVPIEIFVQSFLDDKLASDNSTCPLQFCMGEDSEWIRNQRIPESNSSFWASLISHLATAVSTFVFCRFRIRFFYVTPHFLTLTVNLKLESPWGLVLLIKLIRVMSLLSIMKSLWVIHFKCRNSDRPVTKFFVSETLIIFVDNSCRQTYRKQCVQLLQ